MLVREYLEREGSMWDVSLDLLTRLGNGPHIGRLALGRLAPVSLAPAGQRQGTRYAARSESVSGEWADAPTIFRVP